MPKLRTRLASAETRESTVPSRARPRKPPAKEIAKRKRAALGSGGGRLPTRIRESLERRAMSRRKRPARGKPPARSTRAGKRRPEEARYIAATEQHDRREQRKSDTPETEPGVRAVPATRSTRNEPTPRKHRPRR